MAFLTSLGESPHLYELMKKFPYVAVPLFKLHDVLLRGDAPFTVAERELIAAYVSGLNACAFCFRGHVAAAELFGVAPEVMDQLMADLETAAVDERLKPVLRYARKLTLTPARLTQADADAVYAAGWSEEALFEAVGITALFAMMNRIVDGTGIEARNTKTTIGKVKWPSYTANLKNYGFEAPPDA